MKYRSTGFSFTGKFTKVFLGERSGRYLFITYNLTKKYSFGYLLISLFINDDEAGLHHDFEVWLEKLVPEKLEGVNSQFSGGGAW